MEATKMEKTPDFTISVFINETGEVEDYDLIHNFFTNKFRGELECNAAYYDSHALESNGILDICKQKDALYHLYLKLHWIESYSYEEGTTYEPELEALSIILVHENYSQFLDQIDFMNEQEKLASEDSPIDSFEISDGNWGGVSYSPEFNYQDIKKMLKIVSQKDIYLAHKMASINDLMIEMGDLFDEKIREVESKRYRFKKFLRYNKHFKTIYGEKGYCLISKDRYYDLPIGEKLVIKHEEIDNLQDDILLENSEEDLFNHFYHQKNIMNAFEEENK